MLSSQAQPYTEMEVTNSLTLHYYSMIVEDCMGRPKAQITSQEIFYSIILKGFLFSYCISRKKKINITKALESLNFLFAP